MDIYGYLDTRGIAYQRHDHPAVFTCEDVNRLIPDLPGRKTKNLFLCDGKGKQHYLVCVPDTKAVDLKALGTAINAKRLRLASADRLRKHLKIEPGSVTLLAVANDDDNQVEVVVDQALWSAEALQCHPLVNTATLIIALDHVRLFLTATGHRATVLDVPARN